MLSLLLQIVRNSIVPGLTVSSGALFNGQQLPTLDGQNITVSSDDRPVAPHRSDFPCMI